MKEDEEEQDRASLLSASDDESQPRSHWIHPYADRKILLIFVLVPFAFYSVGSLGKIGVAIKEKPQNVTYNTTMTTDSSFVLEDVYTEAPLASCVWSPRNTSECFQLLSEIIPASSTTKANGNASFTDANSVLRRWLFLGDSTIARIFHSSGLHHYLLGDAIPLIHKTCPLDYKCAIRKNDRCNLRVAYDLAPPNHVWYLPNISLGEGPTGFGRTNPMCQDCSGCNSEYAICTPLAPKSASAFAFKNSSSLLCAAKQKLIYGSYFSIEFARDVSIQSARHFTSQENIAEYIQTYYNTPALVQDFGGKPVCVVRAGIHDMAIPNITTDQFVTNAIWYLHLLRNQCSTLIWLHNTAPRRLNDTDIISQHPQTSARTLEYNQALHLFLEHDTSQAINELRKQVVLVDAFQASRQWPFSDARDNIHKSREWYEHSATFFKKLVSSMAEL